MNEAFIVGSGDGRYLDLGNFEALVLASAAQTSSEFTLLQVQGEPPEFGPPLHLHRDTAEALYVLEGEYLMYVEDRQQLAARHLRVCTPRHPAHLQSGLRRTRQEAGSLLTSCDAGIF